MGGQPHPLALAVKQPAGQGGVGRGPEPGVATHGQELGVGHRGAQRGHGVGLRTVVGHHDVDGHVLGEERPRRARATVGLVAVDEDDGERRGHRAVHRRRGYGFDRRRPSWSGFTA